MTKQEILNSVKQLSREDQVDLAMEVWDIVDVTEKELILTDEMREELDRRMASAEANPQPPEDVESLTGRLLRGEF